MQTWNRYERVFGPERAADFERRVNDAVSNAVREMDKLVDDEVKIQYVTHVFAKTLDQLQDWLTHPRTIN